MAYEEKVSRQFFKSQEIEVMKGKTWVGRSVRHSPGHLGSGHHLSVGGVGTGRVLATAAIVATNCTVHLVAAQ